ncbi:hypothetical protein HY333_00990 [Candidatus Collierbacteria bacterium]|nr:hypothetical protein [Candidatus Collierbacteria bacterium]
MRRLLVFLFIALFLSACTHKKPAGSAETPTSNRQLINELAFEKRPFLAVFPHSSNKLLTLFLDRVREAKSATINVEYLAGNSLKGGRTSVNFPISQPFAQAFLLGSCSSGGKCSFDRDLLTGNLKTRLDLIDGSTHILKSDFVFINGSSVTPDGKVEIVPQASKSNLILVDTQGLPADPPGTPAYSPLAITSTSNQKITAELKVNVADVRSAVYYDGESFKPIDISPSDNGVSLKINHLPWVREVQIVRDDLKGAGETQQLSIFGPVLLLK